ncbi:hypothetical protein NIES2100_29730 [Calothrix sp. NIES-2100]|uniref:hypothetical protein n=1 Tax=Calothrix sp. NIES-2100 TaxID=1954172 RepID=UPI000B618117|nr:hypothetical protein NIES2100_29730 [Calothrix sp. NIES-2100]
MQVLYKKILDLDIWHDYYLGQPDPPKSPPPDYDISEILTVVPTPECLRILRNLHWIFRPQPRGASIFAHVEQVSSSDFGTVIPVNRPERLTFWLVVRDRYFANFTNLPLSIPRHLIYYFSNLSGNQGHALFLTQPLSVYTANTTYHLGQLVTHNGKTLEALRDHTSDSTKPDVKNWNTLPLSQYVTELDQLPRSGLSRTYTIPRASPHQTFGLTLLDVNKQKSFSFEVTVPDTHTPGEPIATSLNFSGQIPGRYRLYLDGTQVDEFVLLDPMAASNAFGLVEILLNPQLVPSAFSLLQPQNKQTLIQPQTYIIRFKNRATHWRYRYEKPHGFTKDELPNFELKDEKTYFTKRPQGLLRQPKYLLIDGKDHLLPAPGVMLIKPETQIDPETEKEAIAIFSDIHL